VVIRSYLYNARTGYLSFSTGGAITIRSDADREYDECLLKAEALIECLKEPITF
jgi:para-aminobenzoate synthetase component 1